MSVLDFSKKFKFSCDIARLLSVIMQLVPHSEHRALFPLSKWQKTATYWKIFSTFFQEIFRPTKEYTVITYPTFTRLQVIYTLSM